MKWSFTLWTLIFTLLLAPPLISQSSCEYALTMLDDAGNGWNGAALTIITGNNAEIYSLNQIDDDGDSTTVFIPVMDGDSILLLYTPAFFFPGEVSYSLFDAGGNLVFQDGQMGAEPMIGLVFGGSISCPVCSPPLSSSVEIERIRAFSADISWAPFDPEGDFLLEYDTTGFSPGTGNFTTATGATGALVNLQENTVYDFYLAALCSNGDTSVAVGPYSFQTPYANDVGIAEILSPLTACGLGAAETISVAIANFGGVPQSLIPFNFAVNGIPGGVTMPQDGFFTGVIATDSTKTTEFDATFNFSDFGEYVIQVWTALEGDSVTANDTTSLTIVNVPEVAEYPYFEGFEEWFGGWTVSGEGLGDPSWEYGAPGGTLINSAASGAGAWVTNLAGSYNNNELSYLLSPCFDFSALAEDPRISFSIIVNTENNFDEAWLEVSADDGETWSKVGSAGTGLNWYNDPTNGWWENDGGVPGWHYAQNTLEGAAGSANVKLRFVFSSDGSIAREGIGLDNILVSPQLENDIAASRAEAVSATNCGSPNDTISLSLVNLGSLPTGGFDVAYSVNGGSPVVENIGNVILLPGDEYTYTFATTFDASVPGAYTIQAWSEFGDDALALNDTVTTRFQTSVMPPLREDFEDGGVPAGWALSPGINIGQAHNSPTAVAYDNLWSGTPSMQITTAAIGPIEEGDTLTFDYRYVDFFSGEDATILSADDSLIVEISLDCGASFAPALVITGNSHIPTTDMTTVELGLGGLAGEVAVFRFRGVWGGGEADYYLDLDNINLRRCPESLQLTADIIPPSSQSAEDGTIAISVADPSGPFTYLWSNGERSKVVNGLGEGVYSVTVTNVYGCTETLEAELLVSSIRTPARISDISLAPNPTRGITLLNVEFTQPVDARIQLLNTVGQLIFERIDRKVSSGSYELDLGQHSNGLYLVRIIAGREVKTAKLIKAR